MAVVRAICSAVAVALPLCSGRVAVLVLCLCTIGCRSERLLLLSYECAAMASYAYLWCCGAQLCRPFGLPCITTATSSPASCLLRTCLGGAREGSFVSVTSRLPALIACGAHQPQHRWGRRAASAALLHRLKHTLHRLSY